RRDKIGRTFFRDVLPLDDFAVRDGKLVFDDLAVKSGFEKPRQYAVSWWDFDNQTGKKTPLPGASGWDLPSGSSEMRIAEIRAENPNKTVLVYLRGQQVAG